MEIAPIAGIRAVGLLQARRASNASQPAFVIDPATGTANESSSSNEETPGRELEDEGNDASLEDGTSAEISAGIRPVEKSIDLFA